MVEVVVTDQFRDWYEALDEGQADSVYQVVEMLRSQGVTLRFPFTSAIEGSKYALRELRIQSSGHPLRAFYIFDAERQAVLLLGGDKKGSARFYETNIPKAERLWEEYLREVSNEDPPMG